MDLQLKGEIQEIITRVVFSEVRYGHCIELGIENSGYKSFSEQKCFPPRSGWSLCVRSLTFSAHENGYQQDNTERNLRWTSINLGRGGGSHTPGHSMLRKLKL